MYFTKYFDGTEKKAKQSTITEIGKSQLQWLDYRTSVINKLGSHGSHDKETWTNKPDEEKHWLSHRSNRYSIRLRVKRKNGRWLATIEIDPEADDCNEIKKSLEDNGWE